MKLGQIQVKLYQIRYELLLLSLISVFVLNTFFPTNYFEDKIQGITFTLQVLAGMNVMFKSKKIFGGFIMFVGIAALTIRYLYIFQVIDNPNLISFLYLFLFSGLSSEVFKEMYHAEIINRKIIYAAICGLLLLGYSGFFVFAAIEHIQPYSFKGLSPGNDGINDLFYYSFISIMTVGYGDICPVSWTAKNATMFVNLISYVYSLVIVSIIVSQFTSNRRRR